MTTRQWSLNKRPCHIGGLENGRFMCSPVMVLTTFLTRAIIALIFGCRWTWSSGGALARLVPCVHTTLEGTGYKKVRIHASDEHVQTFKSAFVFWYLGPNGSQLNHDAWNRESILSLSLSFLQSDCWFLLMFEERMIVDCRFIRLTFACCLALFQFTVYFNLMFLSVSKKFIRNKLGDYNDRVRF